MNEKIWVDAVRDFGKALIGFKVDILVVISYSEYKGCVAHVILHSAVPPRYRLSTETLGKIIATHILHVWLTFLETENA